MQWIIALLVVGGALWWIVADTNNPDDPGRLKIEVASLRSSAAEALKLIEQIEAGRLTNHFFQVETSLLHEKAGSVLKKIRSTPPQPGLEEKYRQASDLADQAEAALNRLSAAADSKEIRQGTSAKLQEVLRLAAGLEKSLQQ